MSHKASSFSFHSTVSPSIHALADFLVVAWSDTVTKKDLFRRSHLSIWGRLCALTTKKYIELSSGRSGYKRIPVTSTRSSDGLPCVGAIGALSGGGFKWDVATKGRDRRTLRYPGWSNESLIGRLPVSCPSRTRGPYLVQRIC